MLGDEFAHDDRQIGDGADDDAVAEPARNLAREPLGLQEIAEPAAERRARERAGEDTDEGDADLHGGQEAPGAFGERERGGRPRCALASAIVFRRGLRAETIASSESEKKPLMKMRTKAVISSSTICKIGSAKPILSS